MSPISTPGWSVASFVDHVILSGPATASLVLDSAESEAGCVDRAMVSGRELCGDPENGSRKGAGSFVDRVIVSVETRPEPFNLGGLPVELENPEVELRVALVVLVIVSIFGEL